MKNVILGYIDDYYFKLIKVNLQLADFDLADDYYFMLLRMRPLIHRLIRAAKEFEVFDLLIFEKVIFLVA